MGGLRTLLVDGFLLEWFHFHHFKSYRLVLLSDNIVENLSNLGFAEVKSTSLQEEVRKIADILGTLPGKEIEESFNAKKVWPKFAEIDI